MFSNRFFLNNIQNNFGRNLNNKKFVVNNIVISEYYKSKCSLDNHKNQC